MVAEMNNRRGSNRFFDMNYMTKAFFLTLTLCAMTSNIAADQGMTGGPIAIADARAMVENMGGAAVWAQLESVHFVHEWDIVNRPDRYLENEILDLTGPRSWVNKKSEIHDLTRAYSPEHGYWSISDNIPNGWILLKVRKEPMIWATTQYVYVFGPLARFGNLWVPNWATTSNGLVRYEMISLTGSTERPAIELFAPPSID
jgi:hypothetical protein